MSTALASIQEKIKAQLERQRGTVPVVTGRNISTKGKVFTLPNGQSSADPISAIIVDYRNFFTYYNSAYDPKAIKPPVCFAISADLDGMVPHESVQKPQCETCADCTFNKWGSAPTGRGKACRNMVRLALVTPNADADEEPMILRVSPTGLKSWAPYVNNLTALGKIPLQVVTQVSFDPNQAYPTLLFKGIGGYDNLDVGWHLREKAQSLLDAAPLSDSE